jgi:hypothetical protein
VVFEIQSQQHTRLKQRQMVTARAKRTRERKCDGSAKMGQDSWQRDPAVAADRCHHRRWLDDGTCVRTYMSSVDGDDDGEAVGNEDGVGGPPLPSDGEAVGGYDGWNTVIPDA